MGTSTDGQISFGIPFEEEYKFPWDDEKYDESIDNWWLYEICSYKDPFKLYDNEGYVGGKRPPEEKISEWHGAKSNFLKNHPLPIEIVNYCSIDYPMCIIAIPETCESNSRGYPKVIEPEKMIVSDYDRNKLINFCEMYCKPKDEFFEFPEMNPKWYLSSYWG